MAILVFSILRPQPQHPLVTGRVSAREDVFLFDWAIRNKLLRYCTRSRIFARGNRAGRCRWSGGGGRFSRGSPVPPAPSLFHTYLASPTSALETSMIGATRLRFMEVLASRPEDGKCVAKVRKRGKEEGGVVQVVLLGAVEARRDGRRPTPLHPLTIPSTWRPLGVRRCAARAASISGAHGNGAVTTETLHALARRSDEALEACVSVARIAPSFLDLGRPVPTNSQGCLAYSIHVEEIRAALKVEVLRTDEVEVRREWSSARMQGRGLTGNPRENPAGQRRRLARFSRGKNLGANALHSVKLISSVHRCKCVSLLSTSPCTSRGVLRIAVYGAATFLQGSFLKCSIYRDQPLPGIQEDEVHDVARCDICLTCRNVAGMWKMSPEPGTSLSKQLHVLRHGRNGVVVRLLTSHPGEPGCSSIPRIFACESRAGRCPLIGEVFSGSSRFPPPPLHSGAAPYSPRFTLIGSQGALWEHVRELSFIKLTLDSLKIEI
ncbi:hypothetical protein PR048_031534 [Dryococelus australis]|uniref:Uncharacterized protein n=1 Tax=Dryococelus australis TaxID=614101 RepID=A0ABQ9G886_9NEOP|nr:hypothetical protein PR048_031534 [Dryococelus australis]